MRTMPTYVPTAVRYTRFDLLRPIGRWWQRKSEGRTRRICTSRGTFHLLANLANDCWKMLTTLSFASTYRTVLFIVISSESYRERMSWAIFLTTCSFINLRNTTGILAAYCLESLGSRCFPCRFIVGTMLRGKLCKIIVKLCILYLCGKNCSVTERIFDWAFSCVGTQVEITESDWLSRNPPQESFCSDKRVFHVVPG